MVVGDDSTDDVHAGGAEEEHPSASAVLSILRVHHPDRGVLLDAGVGNGHPRVHHRNAATVGRAVSSDQHAFESPVLTVVEQHATAVLRPCVATDEFESSKDDRVDEPGCTTGIDVEHPGIAAGVDDDDTTAIDRHVVEDRQLPEFGVEFDRPAPQVVEVDPVPVIVTMDAVGEPECLS